MFFCDFPEVILEYTESKHAKMSIIIYSPTVKLSGVTFISVMLPYQGKTSEGISIGSNRKYVLTKLSNPTESPRTISSQLDQYIFDKVIFQTLYENDIVTSMNLLINLHD